MFTTITASTDFSVDTNKLSLSVKHPIPGATLRFIEYNKNPLIIQTPLLYIPFGFQEYKTKRTLDISFHNIQYSKKTKKLYSTIQEVHQTILEINKATNKKILGIKHYVGYPPSLKTNGDSVKVFGVNKENLPIESVKKNLFACFILQLENLWESDKYIGFNWKILQLRVKAEINLDIYAFVDDPVINAPVTLPLSQDKYSRMLKMGISKQAVEQKKLMDGEIKKPSATDLMTGLSKLKKVQINKNEKKIKNPDTNQFVIDQDTILNALKGLKKK
jgi:hypothetical protein